MLAMNDMPESTLKKRVLERMNALNLNAYQTAKKSKLGESYVRDILRGKTLNPTSAKLQRLANTLETTTAYLIGSDATGATVRQVAAKVTGVPVLGRVAANTWRTVDDDFESDFDAEEVERVPSVSGYPAEWQFGMIVEGNCLNKIARDGDRLVCLDLIKSQVDISEDDLVVIERRKFDGMMRQITAKRVKRTSTGFELWPESTDPDHQSPIVLSKVPDGEEIRIWAKVLWILRRP